MKRAITVEQLVNTKFKIMQFDGAWLASIGKPEMSGVWIAWGHSGNGKTRFAMQLARYLTQFGKVIFDSLEEGVRLSLQRAVIDENMREVGKRFLLLHRESIEDLKIRLRRKRSADIIIIDSFQYTGLSRNEYIALKEEFENKLFIFLSHAEGKNPGGRTADFVRYDADVKIHIQGFIAFIASRYGGGDEYVIWDEGAKIYHGTNSNNQK